MKSFMGFLNLKRGREDCSPLYLIYGEEEVDEEQE